jgi:hypothetical protein
MGLLLAVSLAGCAAPVARPVSTGTKIQLRPQTDGSSLIVVTDADFYDRSLVSKLSAMGPNDPKWRDYLAVYAKSDDGPIAFEGATAMLGSYRVDQGEVIFEPRFPLSRGITYAAYFDFQGGAHWKDATPSWGVTSEEFLIPKPPSAATTTLDAIYPTTDVLPENQLKFYLQFSAPMSRGEAYTRIKLFDADGKEVELPFLELGEELWDPTGTRFTLFFDPGRVKRELLPREQVGPALVEGKSYTLAINRSWPDAQGMPLKEGVRKQFRVAAPDHTCPDPKTWKIEPPAAGATRPLRVTFPEPLDYGLLGRVLTVTDASGQPVEGTIKLGPKEMRWEFRPKETWQEGAYYLVTETILEDLAGNRIDRPFEVDLLKPVQRDVKTETVKLLFHVK